MRNKQTFKVLKYSFGNHNNGIKVYAQGLSEKKANDLAHKMNEKTLQTTNLENVSSFIVQPEVLN